MRITKLSGRNLASLPHLEVDFEHPVLHRAGLFAITGATGSGKSTLLDAICLALYDQTPRLDNGGSDRALLVDVDGESTFSSRSVGSILRQGEGRCWAQVEFVGVDQRRYRARWSLQRAHKKAHKRLQLNSRKVELWELERGEDGAWEEARALGSHRRTETLKLIQDKVGLSFAQFTRAVLLAQGEFAAFLEADTDTRAALLERLTDQTIYSQLSILAFERDKAAAKELDDLQQQQHRDLLEPEARQALEQQLAQERQRLQQLQEQQEQARQHQRWHQHQAQLLSERDAATEARDQALLRHEEAQEQRDLLARVHRAEPLRGGRDLLVEREGRARKAQEVVHGAQEALEGAQEQDREAREQLGERRTQLDQAERARVEAQPDLDRAQTLDVELRQQGLRVDEAAAVLKRLEGDKSRAGRKLREHDDQTRTQTERRDRARLELDGLSNELELAAEWGQWRTRVEQAVAALGQRERARVELEAAQEQARQVQARAERLARSRDQAQQARDQAQADLHQHRASPPESSEQALAERRESLVHQRARLERLAELLEQLHQDEPRRDQLQREQVGARAAKAKHEQALEDLVQDLELARARHDQAALALRRAQQALDLEGHRAQLEEGQPCPLCGSLDHPWAQDAPTQHLLASLQQDHEECVQATRTLEGQQQSHQTQARLADQQLESLGARLKELDERIDHTRSAWHELAQDLSRAPQLDDPQVDQGLARVQEQNQAELSQTQELQQAWKTWTQRDKELDGALQRAERALSTATTSASTAQAEHQAQARELERTKTVHAEAEEALSTSLDALVKALGPRESWEQALVQAPQDFQQSLEARVGRVRQLQQQQQEADQALTTLSAQRPALEQRLEELGAQVHTQQTQLNTLQEALSTTRDQRALLFEGQPVARVRDRLDRAVRTAREALDQATTRAQAAQAALSAAHTRLESSQQQLHTSQEEASEALDQLQDQLHDLDLDRGALDALLQHDRAWQQRQATALDALDQALATARTTLGERERKLAEHQSGAPEANLQQVQALLTQLTADIQALTEANGQVLRDLQRDDEHRAHVVAFAQRIDEAQARKELWGRMRALIGSADGKAFRTYAQSLTMEVLLAETNQQLASLAPRYQLQRIPGEDMALQVVDRSMADSVRTIHSLSGGERFLVSLGLALGLSSLSSRRSSIDSLFIDEGFGTLDPATLDQVLAALSSLQAGGRTVGFISHVQGLAEKIGARVAVERTGVGTSRVRVVGAGVA